MTTPVFMSPEHVRAMNEILAESSAVRAACAELDHDYAMCYELHDGPGGRTVYWAMTFGPDTGVRMSLEKPDRADLTYVGDWARLVRASAAQRRGERHDPDVAVHGDPEIPGKVAAAFTAAQRVATIDVVFPDLGA